MQHVRVFATCKELLPLLNAHSLLNVTPPPPPPKFVFKRANLSNFKCRNRNRTLNFCLTSCLDKYVPFKTNVTCLYEQCYKTDCFNVCNSLN